MIKVSIVIPVYNKEKYLPKCVESLVNQTLKDIEILFINDGSSDKSLEILEKYAENDNRIKIINQANCGQGIARNVGINIAKGDYIGFVDPDDWIELDTYEKMYYQAKKINSDIVICDYMIYQEGNNRVKKSEFFNKAVSPQKSQKVDMPAGVNIDKNLFYQTLLVSPCYSCNRLYKTSLLKDNKIKFGEEKCYEDCIFVFRSHLSAKNISYLNEPLYKYRQNQNSTLKSLNTKHIMLLKVFKNLEKYISENNLSNTFRNNLNYFIVMNSILLYDNSAETDKAIFMKNLKDNLDYNNYKLIKKKVTAPLRKILRTILSIRNENFTHKVICILGIKIKIRRLIMFF